MKVRENKPQKNMGNSYQQVKNLDGVFKISEGVNHLPCILVDDMTDSGWTITVVSALLRNSKVESVLPVALALNTFGD
jgi:ATP-dependent DNA helicase RecQ